MGKAAAAKNRGQKPRWPGAASKRAAMARNGGSLKSALTERKSIEQLAAEQGVRLEGQLERIWGAGADLWASDAEFAEFVRGIYDRRKQGLALGKP